MAYAVMRVMGDPGQKRDSLEDAIRRAFGEPPAADETRKRRRDDSLSALASEVVSSSGREPAITLVDEVAKPPDSSPIDEDRPTLIDPIAPAPTSTDAPPFRPRTRSPGSGEHVRAPDPGRRRKE